MKMKDKTIFNPTPKGSDFLGQKPQIPREVDKRIKYLWLDSESVKKLLMKIRKCPKGFRVLAAIPYKDFKRLERISVVKVYVASEVVTAGAYANCIHTWFMPDPFISYENILEQFYYVLQEYYEDVNAERIYIRTIIKGEVISWPKVHTEMIIENIDSIDELAETMEEIEKIFGEVDWIDMAEEWGTTAYKGDDPVAKLFFSEKYVDEVLGKKGGE